MLPLYLTSLPHETAVEWTLVSELDALQRQDDAFVERALLVYLRQISTQDLSKDVTFDCHEHLSVETTTNKKFNNTAYEHRI